MFGMQTDQPSAFGIVYDPSNGFKTFHLTPMGEAVIRRCNKSFLHTHNPDRLTTKRWPDYDFTYTEAANVRIQEQNTSRFVLEDWREDQVNEMQYEPGSAAFRQGVQLYVGK